jgi:hypothetical protein
MSSVHVLVSVNLRLRGLNTVFGRAGAIGTTRAI